MQERSCRVDSVPRLMAEATMDCLWILQWPQSPQNLTYTNPCATSSLIALRVVEACLCKQSQNHLF